MIVKINDTDISNLIAYQGLSYQRNDIDGPNAGRALNGYMYRDLVTTKDKFTIKLRPLTAQELSSVLTLLNVEYFTFYISNHPRTGAAATIQAYTNNIPAAFAMKKNGVDYWSGISFPVIER